MMWSYHDEDYCELSLDTVFSEKSETEVGVEMPKKLDIDDVNYASNWINESKIKDIQKQQPHLNSLHSTTLHQNQEFCSHLCSITMSQVK